MNKFLPLFLIPCFLALTLPKIVLAEVATVHDWIGLFPVFTGTWSNTVGDTLGLWGYTDPASGGNCVKSSPLNPHLGGSCSFDTSTLFPGAYEFRLNINDTGNFYAGQAAMLSQSKVLWKSFSITLTCQKVAPNTGQVIVNLPLNMRGVTGYNVYRNNSAIPDPPIGLTPINDPTVIPAGTVSYPDPITIAFGTTIYYRLQALNSYRPPASHLSDNSPSIVVNAVNCINPWLQTVGGDVNANQNLNLPHN